MGDLKKVLSNVRTRGTLGEIQLGAILDETLTPEPFARNVQTRQCSCDSVEHAVRLPGPQDSGDRCVWLSLDSKFP